MNSLNFLKVVRGAALAAVVTFAGAAHADTVYNPVTDFSLSGNANGVWSYAAGTPTSTTLLTYAGTNFPGLGFDYWANGAGGIPVIGVNGTPGGTVNVPTDELWLHPGPDAGQDSILLFTAATSGTYDISALFVHRDTGGISNGNADGQIVGIYLNGVLITDSLLGTTYGDSFSYTAQLTLNAGDVLAFDVAKNGTYYNDSTGLKLTITELSATAPEPASIALMGTGVLSIAGAVRRKKRS